jgi:hypothetical protein
MVPIYSTFPVSTVQTFLESDRPFMTALSAGQETPLIREFQYIPNSYEGTRALPLPHGSPKPDHVMP